MTDFSSYSNGMNKTLPAGTEAIAGGDDRIREMKEAIAYGLNVDHVFAYSGNTCDAVATGEHRQITYSVQIADPTVAANKLITYTKDVTIDTTTIAELFAKDEAGNVIQLTSAGMVYLGDNLDHDEEVQLTNTGNSFYGDLIVCTADGRFCLPKGEEASFDTTEGNVFYETDGDVVKFRTASAWLTVLTTLSQSITYCVHGTALGAGSDLSKDIGFEPDLIIAWNDGDDTGNVLLWSSLMTGNKNITTGTTYGSETYISVTSTTVTFPDNNDFVNVDEKNMFYIAIKLSASQMNPA